MHPAGTVIQQMRKNDQYHRRDEQPCFILFEELLNDKEDKTGNKKKQGQKAMMMFFIPMIKRVAANTQGQQDHTHFKPGMMNDIDPEQRQAAEK